MRFAGRYYLKSSFQSIDNVLSLEWYHSISGITTMSDNQRLRNPTTKLPLTCFFWNNGRCTKSDEGCRYHHADTGVIARPPGTQGDKELTCYYWSRGQCELPAESCHYAHFFTGQVAPAPRRPSEVSARPQGLVQNQFACGQSRQQQISKCDFVL